MHREFDIQRYMTGGVERIVADALRATVKNPRESAYMLRFASASKKASKKRAASENKGEHIPPFLIASITSSCNLHCAGCYSRCNEATTDREPVISDEQRDHLIAEVSRIRSEHQDMVFVSFPGDEKSSGGCTAAGRGFFHINSHGGAEPCPFLPYSNINVRETSVRDALNSKLFTALRDGDYLKDDHVVGCVLYEKRAAVERMLGAKC